MTDGPSSQTGAPPDREFSARLWRSIEATTYRRIADHPFVTGLADGTLARECFEFYVIQDAHYLADYGRALALAAARSPGAEHVALFASHAAQAIEVERALHRETLDALGIDRATVAATPPAPTTVAYGDHLLRVCALGDYHEAVCALLPCYWIYLEIGRRLAEHGSPDSAYQRWIDTYSGEEFAVLVRPVISLTDAIGRSLTDDQRSAGAARFARSSAYELRFWEMALRRERWQA